MHIGLAADLEAKICAEEDFELMAPRLFSLVCFRYKPKGISDEAELNRINEELLRKINQTGKAFLSHTKLNGKYTLRMSIAQTNVQRRHVEAAWEMIRLLSLKF